MADRKEIEALFRLYYRPLCLYAIRLLKDAEISEDVVQESFITYWDKGIDGDKPSSAKSYLYRTVHNKCVDILKGKDNFSRLDFFDYDIVDEPAADRSFIWARLWSALNKLPEKRKEILLMNKRDGLTYSQIASKLGISEHTVHSQITKALKTLREGAKIIYLFFFV